MLLKKITVQVQSIVKNLDNTEEVPEDVYLVLVDDDMIYKPYMLEHFDTFRRHKEKEEMEMVDVASYYVYDENNILIGQCADGFFIRWKCLSDFLRYFEILENEDYLLYHDNYYISFYFHLLQKKIHKVDLHAKYFFRYIRIAQNGRKI